MFSMWLLGYWICWWECLWISANDVLFMQFIIVIIVICLIEAIEWMWVEFGRVVS